VTIDRDRGLTAAARSISTGSIGAAARRQLVDVPAHRYSVAVRGTGIGVDFVPLATDYAFRTEQAAASSLAVLAQYIDAPADADHALITCDLTAMY
jgi:hypothetical protein